MRTSSLTRLFEFDLNEDFGIEVALLGNIGAIIIAGVTPGGQAEILGVQKGWYVLKVSGEPYDMSGDQFIDLLRERRDAWRLRNSSGNVYVKKPKRKLGIGLITSQEYRFRATSRDIKREKL
mmetsp:Transcript_34652/g.55896  ORF Transcript_34652/g.55896 Transcript_34652/m.55896 type:complete len:122 (-) Transcript_34652:54-419(-)